MKNRGRRITLTFELGPHGIPWPQRLKLLLKHAGRRHRMRCVGMSGLDEQDHDYHFPGIPNGIEDAPPPPLPDLPRAAG